MRIHEFREIQCWYLNPIICLICTFRGFYVQKLINFALVTCMARIQTGFLSVTEHIEHLQLVITSSYISIDTQFTTARTKPSQSAMSSLVVVW
jgi:hypothetical protein